MSLVNAVKAAVYARLSGDATLTGLASGGVHDRTAPQGSVCPYVILAKQAGTAFHMLGNNAGFDEQLFLVKGVTDEHSAKKAGEIAERADTLLNRYALTIAGGTLLVCRRELDVDYDERTDGHVFKHVGHIYRIGVQ